MAISPAALYADETIASATTIAELLDGFGPDLQVPSCPGWDLRTLATHIGRVHRWSATIVATRSADRVDFRSVADGRFPDDPAARGPWLIAGAHRVVEEIRAAGEEPVWAFGTLRPASFWARRQSHETMVHRADAQLAAGQEVRLRPALAADAIDEWLTVMSGPRRGGPDPREQALPAGSSLSVRTTDPGLPPAGWLVTHDHGEVRVLPGPDTGDAQLTGPAADVLLVLLRRYPPDTDTVSVAGDPDLLRQWLTHTSF